MKKITLVASLCLIVNILFAQVNLTQGLLAYYPFTGNANDASGNGHNPSVNTATLTYDRAGNANSAYHFNGTSSYIQIPTSPTLALTNQISVCFQVRPTGFYAGTCHGNNVIGRGHSDATAGNYALRYSDYVDNCTAPVNPNNEVFVPTGPVIQLNTWYNVVFTCDGTTTKWYINSVLAYSGPANGQSFTSAEDIFMGKWNDGTFPYWLNADLDEVRIYNRALTTDEVTAYNVISSVNYIPKYSSETTFTKSQIFDNGTSVGIGTVSVNNSDYKLYVEKGIRTRRITVDAGVWADYVFDNDYALPALSDVEKYIKENKHLPGINTTAEVKSNGVDLGDNQAELLKKVEELTLYMIQQNKVSQLQEEQIDKLQKQLKALKKK